MANGSDTEYLAYVHGRTTHLRRTAYLAAAHGVEERTILRAALSQVPARQQAVLVLRSSATSPSPTSPGSWAAARGP
jgi:hypothetical protein